MESLFDTISGLPVHPLVVHGAVVLLPLSALGLLAVLLKPAWRERFGVLVVLGLVAGAVAAFVSVESGEALAARVGLPEEHGELGERLTFVSVVLAVVTMLWYFAGRRSQVLSKLAGGLAALLALAVLVLTVMTGHSGAQAAWKERIAPKSEPGTSGGAALTAEEVARHNSAADCWTSIEGKVYDLTAWASRHPGGAQPIEGLCGTDGSAAFRGQHGTAAGPTDRLQEFLLGPLVGAAPAADPAPNSDRAITASQVKRHRSTNDCWTIINGGVYDLTDWVSRHPGGQEAIAELCGEDETEDFVEQHGGNEKVAGTLAGFKIGTLKRG
jgi:cytochrome b involved in lipid metabolism